MPKKTIVVRKRPRTKVAASDEVAVPVAPVEDSVPLEPPPLPEDPAIEEPPPQQSTIRVKPAAPLDQQGAKKVAVRLTPSAAPAAVTPVVKADAVSAAKPAVKPIVKVRPRRVAEPEAAAQPVYEGAVDADRLGITQQVIDLPGTLGTRTDAPAASPHAGLMDSMYDAVLLTSLEGAIREANARAEEKFGVSRTTLCEMNVTELIAGSDVHLVDVLRANCDSRKFTVLEATCVRYDESRFPAEIVANYFTGDEDNTLCFFIRDVTRRKDAEQASKDMAAKLGDAEALQVRLEEIKGLLYEFNDPVQVLLCLADLQEEKGNLRAQLDRVVDVLDQLMVFADGVDVEGHKDSDGAALADLEPVNTSRVLIIDDQDALAETLARTLATADTGLVADTAADAAAAMKLFEDHHHGVVVMDVPLSDMGGEQAYDTLCAICERRRWDGPGFIFCSPQDPGDGIKALSGDGSDHEWLRKPFASDELVKRVTARLRGA